MGSRLLWFLGTLVFLGSCNGCLNTARIIDLSNRVTALEVVAEALLSVEHGTPFTYEECASLAHDNVICVPQGGGYCHCVNLDGPEVEWDDEEDLYESEEEIYPWEYDDPPGIDL